MKYFDWFKIVVTAILTIILLILLYNTYKQNTFYSSILNEIEYDITD